MDYQDNLKIVEKLLSREALLNQLAEEAVELSKAILLYKEKTDHRHHLANTIFAEPMLTEWKELLEEGADLELVIEVVLAAAFDSDERKIYKNIIGTMDVVVSVLTTREVLKTMQKLCHDVAKAALKLNRAAGRENPTPISEDYARKQLLCHMASMMALHGKAFVGTDKEKTEEIKTEKAARWVSRLTGGMGNEGVYEDRPEFLGK